MAVGQTIGKRYWVRANGVVAAESETRSTILARVGRRARRVMWIGAIARRFFLQSKHSFPPRNAKSSYIRLSDRTSNPSPQRVVG